MSLILPGPAGGTEFESGAQMQAALMGAFAREEAQVTVLRGGRRVVLTVRGRVLQERAGRQGGRLEPVSR